MAVLLLTLNLLAGTRGESAAEPDALAMVLSVRGATHHRPMDLLRRGDEVQVSAASQMRLVFFADGHRETLNVAGKVTITDSGGKPAGLVKHEKTSVPVNHLHALRMMAESARGGVAYARGTLEPPMPVAPIHLAIVLTDRPSFEWMPVRDAKHYTVELFQGKAVQKEHLCWSESTPADRLHYPSAHPALLHGEAYTWTVTTHANEVVAKGCFKVSTQKLVRDIETIRKLAESPDVADRLLAALLYEKEHVYGESHRLFDTLAKEMPTEPCLILASARHLARMGRTEDARHREKQAMLLMGQKP